MYTLVSCSGCKFSRSPCLVPVVLHDFVIAFHTVSLVAKCEKCTNSYDYYEVRMHQLNCI